MLKAPLHNPASAEPFLPQRFTLPLLRHAVQDCRGCNLYRHASQAVFGEVEDRPKAATAAMMMVGEQPGDREDIEGRPFVGPAGQLLDRCCFIVDLKKATEYLNANEAGN